MVRRAVQLAMVGVALLLSGCASTRMGQFGVLPNHEPLVTLIVSEDRQVVQRECAGTVNALQVLGCQSSHDVPLPDGGLARSIRIVRYTDSLPSAVAFEIDIHELCHAVATLQPIGDPCHVGNNGVLQSALDSNRDVVRWVER